MRFHRTVPFWLQECDHCETGDLAYAHIAPILSAIAAELGKTAEELVIYDPYFCQGSTIRRLASLGFPRVYNRNEDFYEVGTTGGGGGVFDSENVAYICEIFSLRYSSFPELLELVFW